MDTTTRALIVTVLCFLSGDLPSLAAPWVAPYTDSSRLERDVTRIIQRFHRALGRAGVAPAPRMPRAEVRTTASLISWRAHSYRVRVSLWAGVPPPQKQVFAQWTGSPSKASRLFGTLFNWFFVAHELCHYLQTRFAAHTDHWQSERTANVVAVAYWREQPGGAQRLRWLHGQLRAILRRLPNPVPNGVSAQQFFNRNYQRLVFNPDAYGYFQFRFVVEALDARSRLRFASLVRKLAKGRK